MSEPDLKQLGMVVARDVNRTVGGGMAAMELMRRSFQAREWLDASGHALCVAVSRLTPGTNVLAYCLAVGWRFRGAPGGLVALLAGSVPASILIWAMSAALVSLDRYRLVRVLLAFGMLAAAGLVLSSAWNLVRPYLDRARLLRTLAMSVAAILLYLAGLTPVRVLLLAAVVAAALPGPDRTVNRTVNRAAKTP